MSPIFLWSNRIAELLTADVNLYNDYYPFGLAYNSYKRESSVKQDYQYNGKELQDELNLDWLDYGARMYMPELGRFFSQDRFAEKYSMLTPYHYGANNPLLFIDMNGDSLVVNGEQSAVDKFKALSDQGLGGFYNTTVNDQGLVSLQATGKEGDMTPEQEAFFAGMSQSTSLDAPVVKVGLVESSNEVLVGSYNLQQIDVDDVAAFGNDGPATSSGALIHEVTEQHYKQAMGQDYGDDNSGAHGLAISHEDAVNGSTRSRLPPGESSPGTVMTAPRPSYMSRNHYTSSGNLNIDYTKNGQTTTVSMRIKYGNVTNVEK